MSHPTCNRFQLGPHPVALKWVLQLLSLFFLVLTGCTSPVAESRSGELPNGLYHFEAKPAVPPQFAQVTWTSAGWKVTLLGDTGGTFVLQPGEGNALKIVDDEMSYPGLKRIMNGKGQLDGTAGGSGNLEIWLGGAGPVKRNHRKAEWVLRPATPKEQSNWERRQKLLEERKKRASEAGLDI